MRHLCILLASFLMSINCFSNGTWSQIGVFNGGACDMPFSFTIGNKGYVGGGRTSINTFKSDFWEFDPVMNSWTQKSSYPGGNKSSEASFVINNKAYVGLGFNLSYHDQMYEYDPLTNVWAQKATFPGGPRYSCAWFTVGASGYIVCGWDGSAMNDCWEYTPATDTWTQRANFPGGARQAQIGFALNNMGYVCTGFNSPTHYNDLWQFDPINNQWTQKAPFPGSPRRGCSSFVINNEAYVGMGFDGVYKTDFYKYNPVSDTWSQETDIGGVARYNTFYFALNNKGYIGVGSYDTLTSPSFTDEVWVFEPASNYNLIQGTLFADFNSNNLVDTLEPQLFNKKIIENNTGNIAFTNQYGFYSLVVNDTGDFHVSLVDSLDNFTSSPATYDINFSALLQVDSSNDFAMQPNGVFNDLCLTLNATNNFRSGMTGSYVINYSNVGNTVLNGTVVFYPDSNLTFNYSNPAASSITPDSVIIVLGTINPFQSGQIYINVDVALGLPIGTLITSSAMITPIIGDVNPSCNLATWDLLTTGSYDPNDIMVNRNFLFDYEVPSQPDLEYLIRFQNTGNDTAFTVRVMNPIDTTKLLLNTFDFVSASQPATITWLPAEQSMRFLFQNILLPDSNVNEPASHGFIRYKIKSRPNLLIGDSINSQAFIYFDFNSAVPTNIASTVIISPVGYNEFNVSNEGIYVYPNPVQLILNVQLGNAGKSAQTLDIYNIYGQKIQSIEVNKNIDRSSIMTIDVSNFNGGIYFIKSSDGSAITRFVKY